MGTTYRNWVSTRDGTRAIIYEDTGVGEYPLIGAYFNGEEWIPCAWRIDGRHRIDEQKSNLDLCLVNMGKNSLEA